MKRRNKILILQIPLFLFWCLTFVVVLKMELLQIVILLIIIITYIIGIILFYKNCEEPINLGEIPKVKIKESNK